MVGSPVCLASPAHALAENAAKQWTNHLDRAQARAPAFDMAGLVAHVYFAYTAGHTMEHNTYLIAVVCPLTTMMAQNNEREVPASGG